MVSINKILTWVILSSYLLLLTRMVWTTIPEINGTPKGSLYIFTADKSKGKTPLYIPLKKHINVLKIKLTFFPEAIQFNIVRLPLIPSEFYLGTQADVPQKFFSCSISSRAPPSLL